MDHSNQNRAELPGSHNNLKSGDPTSLTSSAVSRPVPPQQEASFSRSNLQPSSRAIFVDNASLSTTCSITKFFPFKKEKNGAY